MKQSIDYTLGENVIVLSVARDGEPVAVNSNRLNFTIDGKYTVTAEAEGASYTFTLTLDTTASMIVLNGVEKGGAVALIIIGIVAAIGIVPRGCFTPQKRQIRQIKTHGKRACGA